MTSSDQLQKKEESCVVKKTSIGGMALIEGIMMIGPKKYAVVVRKPDGGMEVSVKPMPKKTVWTKIPVVRGGYNLIRQMVLGIKSLMFSADFVDIEEDIEEEPSKFEKFLEDKLGDKAKDAAIYFAVFLSVCLSVGLFILLPNLLTGFLGIKSNVLNNIIEGVLRITIFFAYIILATKLEDIQRVWKYHGAEHKTINCYEAGLEITVENARKMSTHNPRCGTSFLFIVMIVSILLFSLVGWHSRLLNMAVRIALIPLVAGLSYELLRLAGKYDNLLTRIVSAPGMFLQRFTTDEPDDSMLEVAITAFNKVKTDGDEDKW
ncbi:MAG: DUF1385 domain-containing protein [Clostridia bacterium]|nr:DUF1385 domain-containing protein [Clostridiaceae bacterium]